MITLQCNLQKERKGRFTKPSFVTFKSLYSLRDTVSFFVFCCWGIRRPWEQPQHFEKDFNIYINKVFFCNVKVSVLFSRLFIFFSIFHWILCIMTSDRDPELRTFRKDLYVKMNETVFSCLTNFHKFNHTQAAVFLWHGS